LLVKLERSHLVNPREKQVFGATNASARREDEI